MNLEQDNKTEKVEEVYFKFHPRVLTSLGAELVTHDTVAIIELVKNSYDAFAKTVNVRILQESANASGIKGKRLVIEIEDNGIGMTRENIRDNWCVVATPNKQDTPILEAGDTKRRVSGEKGLGRLSAARLGKTLTLITKTKKDGCISIEIDWDRIVTDNSEKIKINKCDLGLIPGDTGTIIRVSDLCNDSNWDIDVLTGRENVEDLKTQLSRFISPFGKKPQEFRINFSTYKDNKSQPINIKPPKFLSKPYYLIKGEVDQEGVLKGDYVCDTPEKKRNIKILQNIWSETIDIDGTIKKFVPACGPFEFEIRVWDNDPDAMLDMTQRFNLKRADIRKYLRMFGGIYLYRDGILVIPKSDVAKDWLGVNIRRVSKVGERLSTTQVFCFFIISLNTFNLRNLSHYVYHRY